MTTQLAPRPTVAPPPAYTFPTPRTRVLGNGLTVEHYPSRSRLITLTLVTPAGTLAEPAGSEGIAIVAATLRDEGTARHTGEQFAAALDRIGASYETRVTDGATLAILQVPVAGLAPALGLLAETAMHATYPEDEFERVRAIVTDRANSARLNPGMRANQVLHAACFRPEDRASLPESGVATSLKRLTRDDVAAFDRANLLPEQATLLVGGNVAPSALDDLLDETFSDWRGKDRRAVTTRTADPASPRVIVVDRPGSVQTEIRLGLVGPGPSDSRYPALRVATHVLGGSMNSRLSAVLREEKGYTYGVHGWLRSLSSRGQFMIATPVDTPSTGPAVADLVSIIETMRADGITEAECSGAVGELLLGAPLELQTAAAVVNQRAMDIAQRLPAGWFNEHRAALKQVSASSASAVFAGLVAPSALSAAFVGDAEKIMPELEAVFGGSAITVEPF
ncbi:M16 family metallopeptidase [Sphaerisporangium fuscum]|uniref:M16 family metallopeptidase n=1 Tax=Sphaerisporangium fuscum TaxID=2835868 RepID=UPI001BDCE0C2|nr:pitrilysin family protein [Sphaerisporangium fuscum]